MKALTFSFILEEKDWERYSSFYVHFNPSMKKWQKETFCYYMLVSFIIYGIASMFSDKDFALFLFFIAYATIFISSKFNPYKKVLEHYSSSILPSYLPKTSGNKNGNNCEIIINNNAFVFKSVASESKWSWAFFDDVVIEKGVIFLIQRKTPLFFIPNRVFKNDDDVKKCSDILNSFIKKRHETAPNNPWKKKREMD